MVYSTSHRLVSLVIRHIATVHFAATLLVLVLCGWGLGCFDFVFLGSDFGELYDWGLRLRARECCGSVNI